MLSEPFCNRTFFNISMTNLIQCRQGIKIAELTRSIIAGSNVIIALAYNDLLLLGICTIPES